MLLGNRKPEFYFHRSQPASVYLLSSCLAQHIPTFLTVMSINQFKNAYDIYEIVKYDITS